MFTEHYYMQGLCEAPYPSCPSVPTKLSQMDNQLHLAEVGLELGSLTPWPGLLKCGPQSRSIIWELVRNAHSRAMCQIYCVRNWGQGSAVCGLTCPPGSSDALTTLRTAISMCYFNSVDFNSDCTLESHGSFYKTSARPDQNLWGGARHHIFRSFPWTLHCLGPTPRDVSPGRFHILPEDSRVD